ncbi:MAG TPA: GNAT family protein [Lachnospiraceae bacterium]|nr:GNAT family protein [Lachnospiraceae bacterium]
MYMNEEIININEHELLLRNAKEEDAEMLLEYLKTTCGETRFLVKEPEEITLTLDDERQFINNQNSSKNNLMLLGFLDGEYVGNCSFMGMSPCRYQHRVSMGIALYQKYTGIGIGIAMIEKLFAIAKETGIEQIELEVVADNERAISLYKKMGFEIYGTFPNNMKYKDGTYNNAYWMMKQL